MKGKASDVLGDLNIGVEAKLSAALVADLTAASRAKCSSVRNRSGCPISLQKWPIAET